MTMASDRLVVEGNQCESQQAQLVPLQSEGRRKLSRQESKLTSVRFSDSKLTENLPQSEMMSLCKEVEARLDQKLAALREQIMQDVHATIRIEVQSLVAEEFSKLNADLEAVRIEEMGKLREELEAVRTETSEATASFSSPSPSLYSPEVVSESGCTGYQIAGSIDSMKRELCDSVLELLKTESAIPSFSQDLDHIQKTMKQFQRELEERISDDIQIGGVGAKDLHSMIKDTANLSLSLAKELKRDRQQRNRDYSENVERFQALESLLQASGRVKTQRRKTSEKDPSKIDAEPVESKVACA